MGLVALSTVSVYPESTAHAFAWAAAVGYDAVEVMVGTDATSTHPAALASLAAHHRMPVCAVHAPCLLFTQRVWGTEPWEKLRRSAQMARDLGADVVVVHPPFRWQREYAIDFVQGISDLTEEYGLAFAVENMYPWKAATSQPGGIEMYQPSWDPSLEAYRAMTLDVSHAAISGSDVVEMAQRMGSRLRHLHLTDGTDSITDEHLVPGRGDKRPDLLLQHLAREGFAGHVVLEINTRKALGTAGRERDLVEALAFARRHLGQEPGVKITSRSGVPASGKRQGPRGAG